MTTFYDPAKIRELADAGDPFWKGAAWILNQQDAARIDTTDYDAEWRRDPPPDVIAAKKAEVRERLNARRLGLPYPARLDVDDR